MNDCLSLPLRQGAGGIRRLEGWESLWMALGEGDAGGLPKGRGEGWAPAEVPAQQAASEGRSALWYRCSFRRPDHSGRVLLRFAGAFLACNVWLNGRFLGSHYGYFGAFGFDITSQLAEDNLLVLCCESPIEKELHRKHHVMGIFNDGDCRPYPSSAYFSLPERFRWEVPLGLWAPVELQYLGPVAVDWLRLRTRLEAGDVGVVEAEARLRNLDGRDMAGEVVFSVTGVDGRRASVTREYSLPGAYESTLSFSLSLPGAQRWSPWRLGNAVLYGAELQVAVDGRESVRVAETFGFRELAVSASPEGWSIAVNGRNFFVRGACYVPDVRLDRLTTARFEADLQLARDANLDALRVHAHVLPEEFYRAADRAGMLVVADFPMVGAYAYHAGLADTRFFEGAVRSQVPEMVEMLRNRPSIAWWVAHDDPPWIAANADLSDLHSVRQNYSIDQEARALIERLDPGRLALAGSGDLDPHFFLGGEDGTWDGYAGLRTALAGKYGVQAAPALESPVWDSLGRDWPVADDHPDWLHAGLQPYAAARGGAGVPSDYVRLEDFVTAGMEHQASVLSFATDQFRRRKFADCWGAFVYLLTDPYPGFGFGLVDHHRHPRPALAAVREAMAAVRLVIEPVGFVADGATARFTGPEPPRFRLVVVNDEAATAGAARVRWVVRAAADPRLPPDHGPVASVLAVLTRMIGGLGKRTYSGVVELEMPLDVEPALEIERMTLPVPEGDHVLEAELWLGPQLKARTSLAFACGPPRELRRRRPVPAYLAERLVLPGSVASDPRGLTCRLLNRTRPAALTEVRGVRVDGHVVDPRHLLVEISGHMVALPRRLDLPLERPVTLLVDLGGAPGPGDHQVELDLTVSGVASGRLTVGGTLKPADTVDAQS